MAEPEGSLTPAVGPRTLWLPLVAPGPTWAAAGLLGLYYLVTMSRGLSFYDSGELALAAVEGGLSHPPGHPLYTVLGFLLSRLPLPPLLSLNALSAIPAALALIPLTSLAEALVDGRGERWRGERFALPALLAGLALHPAIWEVATRIEVYGLASFFALWALARAAHDLGAQERRPAWRWVSPGLGLGLTAAVNPVMAVAAALSLSPALVSALLRRRLGPGGGLWFVGGGLLGCLPYLYVPLVAGRRGVFVWGEPTGGEALRRYITFADFAHNQAASLGVVARHGVEWIGWAAGHGLLPGLLLGLSGHLIWGRAAGLGRAVAPLLLGATLFFIWRNGVYYPDVADYLGYLMVPLSLLSAGVAALLVRISRVAEGGARPKVLAALLGAALLANASVTAPSLLGRTRQRDGVARALAQGALERAPRDAVLIIESDHWVFPALYLQQVEGHRPDVIILARGLSGASWFWRQLYARHPGLRQIELRGPGGQPARIRRFLAANLGRPVLFEDWSQALSLGLRPACAGPFLLRDRAGCPADEALRPDELTALVEGSMAALGQGSPTTDAVLAKVALDRGEALWRLGRPAEALRALRAGVPEALLPPPPRPPPGDATPPLVTPLPRWLEDHAIGHPSRNLYLAATLLARSGDEPSARAHLRAALDAGFEGPELVR